MSRWVRQTLPPAHVCELPGGGRTGDLARCDCGELWRLAAACDYCDRYGPENHTRGSCMVGRKWRPATTWQRLTKWRR